MKAGSAENPIDHVCKEYSGLSMPKICNIFSIESGWVEQF